MRRLRAALLAVAALHLLQTAVRLSRELAEYRRSSGELGTTWTVIPARHKYGLLRIHARVAGRPSPRRPAAVLVHGYGVGTSYLIPFAARLARHLLVLAPDLPGHGLSDHDARPLTIPELADALGAWMDGYDLKDALLIGHSLGCQVIAELAVRRPELARGLVLIGPTSDLSGRSVVQQLVRGIVTSAFERPGYVIRISLDYRRAGFRLLRHEMREMITHRIEDVLPRVAAPSQVVRGGRDRLVPKRWADTVARLARAPEPVALAGWGHAVQYDDPGAVIGVALRLAPASDAT